MKNDIIIGPTVLQSHEVFSKWILNPILTLFDSTYEPPKIKILNWYKNQGDLLNTTDNLLNVQIEINTGNDNVIPINYDLISPREGILIDTKYKVGDYVEFGKAIAVIDFEEKEEMLEDEIEENEIIEEEVDDPNNINYKKIISDIKIEISSRLIDNIEESKKLLLKCETAKSLSEEVYSYFPEDIFEENEDIYNEISGVKDKLFKILIESILLVKEVLKECIKIVLWDDEESNYVNYFPLNFLGNIYSRMIELFIVSKDYDIAIFCQREKMNNNRLCLKDRLKPTDYYRLGKLYYITGLKDEAIKIFENITKDFPESSEAVESYKILIKNKAL